MNELNKEKLIRNAVEIAKFAEENPKEWIIIKKEIDKRLK